MESKLKEKQIASLPMKCKLCGEEMKYFDSATIIDKYNINYFECPRCGFIQTEDPYWLPEVYNSAITSSDIGLIRRNIIASWNLDVLFHLCKSLRGANYFLDYGGGYGMLVRMMRDKGYDFEWYDEYCDNLFAQGHEKRRNHYDVITSFEMLEHLPAPKEELSIIFDMCDTAIFSTELIPLNRPKTKEWWYYGLEHGQHISFYSHESMIEIANKYDRYYNYIEGLHIFSINKIRIPYSAKLLMNAPKVFPKLLNSIGEKRKLLL